MSLPAPRHVNQLTAGGTFPNGKPSGGVDCMVASGVMCLDAFTYGRLVPSTTEFRARQRDQDRGIGLDDVAEAFKSYGLTFSRGPRTWAAIMARLRAGDGLIMQGRYIALAPYRAPGSSYTGPHALYVQRVATKAGIIVNDPLRSGPVALSEATLLKFYLTGGAFAGWGTGSGDLGGAGNPNTDPGGAAMLGAWNNIVSYPVGHIITAADVEDMIARLNAAGWFDSYALHALGTAPQDAVRAVLRTAIGKSWTKALQDELAKTAMAAAVDANPANALGAGIGAVGDAIAGIPAAIGGVVAHAGQAALIAGVLILGVYLLVRGR